MSSSVEGSEIVNISNGETKFIKQRLPVGYVCHAVRTNSGMQYVYDVFCSFLNPQEIELSPSHKCFAVRLSDCKVIQRTAGNNEFFYLQAPSFHFQIYNVLQTFNRYVSLKEYLAENGVNGSLDCWITPVRCTKDASEWVLVPSFFVPKPLYMYSKLFEKMEVMLSNIYTTADSKKGLGVVVGVGKIAVQQELINCSAKFELGSTRVCVYTVIEVVGIKTVLLVKSIPVKLKRRYVETFVTPGGSVLIKTIVKNPFVGQPIELAQRPSGPETQPRLVPPSFNYSRHPFFGKIVFSTKMVWSAPTLKVIIGGAVNSNCTEKKSASVNRSFLIQHHILAIHDSERYLRLPDVPDEMFDSKNYLIENGVPLWSERLDKKKNPSNQLVSLQLLRECCIEGRYLSNQFIKNSESKYTYLSAAEAERKKRETEDDYYVTNPYDQISRYEM
uniref:Uncharacterized protein n=1 Tax=Panagrolaimus sp. ES5 TaxID=591445 RepID=A0AC34GU42_9BILA